jgi:DNA-binding NarL/FixJ family response regulator
LFVVISHRLDFLREWTAVLCKRGEVVAFARPEDWDGCLDGRIARLVVIDFQHLGSEPTEGLKQWRRQCGTACLILSGAEFPPQRELAALAVGVVACCGPSLGAAEMERVLDVVLKGGVWISPATLPHFVSRLQAFSARKESSPDPDQGVSNDPFAALTERQREVALLVGQGASNKKIATQLDITDRTVKAHLGAIFEKLGIKDRLQLALLISKQKL